MFIIAPVPKSTRERAKVRDPDGKALGSGCGVARVGVLDFGVEAAWSPTSFSVTPDAACN